MTERKSAWVGIDVGKTAHHAYVLDETGARCWSQKVANDQGANEQLIARTAATAGEVRWAVDLTGNAATLLLAVLITNRQRVFYIPARVVNRMTGVFRGEAKTDAKDARIIAETARMRSDLTEVTTPDELVLELTRLTSHRTDLMADWVRGVNRLRDLLTGVFPALERKFDYSTRSAPTLISGYCTPGEVRDTGTDNLIDHLHRHGVRRPHAKSIVEDASAAARTQTVRLPGETTTATLVKRLARRLLDLDREIKDTDKLITGRFRDHVLFGLPISRIRHLTVDQLENGEAGCFLRTGRHPLLLPPKLAALFTQLADIPRTTARLSKQDKSARWLFPGLTPGRPTSQVAFTHKLRDLGINARTARNAALVSLAGDLPVPILADVLGLHTTTAERWTHLAQRDWTAYIADRVADTHPRPRDRTAALEDDLTASRNNTTA